MPIRMEKDPEQPRRNDEPASPRSGGSNPLLNFLPFIFMFLFKKPKLLIPIVLIGGVLYFMGAFDGCLGQSVSDENDYESSSSQFSFGATLNQEMFDKAEVFEPLSSTYGAPSLPPSASLLRYAPKRLHQGGQGSCVGWASSYAARTILQARATGASPNDAAFSPSSLYNRIALSGCEGAYMLDAMKTMHQQGVLPFREFGYDERSCSKQLSSTQQSAAAQYKIKGYNRLTVGAGDYRPDINAIKQNLAQGAPVVIGMMVGGSFMQGMVGQSLWRPTQRDYGQYGFGGHAMCVIGYDDNQAGGAFQIMNSWGPEWGDNGVAWVRYADFENFTKEAYGLYPMGSVENLDPNKLAVKYGLVNNATQTLIPLKQIATGVFGTASPIRSGDKFKIAITNSVDCYTYVFGEETDGSSYVLFPYTEKHSPYCGIVGTRVFPKDYSMTADNVGNKDRIAVVVSKEALDYKYLNQQINASRQRGYQAKLQEALARSNVANVSFTNEQGAVGFQAALNGKNTVGVVIEIDKK